MVGCSDVGYGKISIPIKKSEIKKYLIHMIRLFGLFVATFMNRLNAIITVSKHKLNAHYIKSATNN